jgi:GDP/UDP-N,N'-diacetylbacillosamine 2-epimerase (hydrolysing)
VSGPVRRVCYITGTRADFGLMRSTLRRIAADPMLRLDLIVTGMHLDALYGATVAEIDAEGWPQRLRLPLALTPATGATMARNIGLMTTAFTDALASDPPDLLLLLGDRGEMLAGALAALNQGVPTVHLHGGERSGTVDEPVRHAISKLCNHHLVATEGSRERLIRMGEAPERIHVVGAPGLDGLTALAAGERADALRALGMPAGQAFVLVVFHPVVQQAAQAHDQTLALLDAVQRLALPVLWLEPNADAGAHGVLQALDEHPLPAGSRRIAHLGRPLFSQAMRHAAVMLGNSSSGIIEAASFGTPVVNVGDRQRLRERNPNTTDVPVEANAIATALLQALDHGRHPPDNRYGDGQSAARIVRLLRELPLSPDVLEKCNAY